MIEQIWLKNLTVIKGEEKVISNIFGRLGRFVNSGLEVFASLLEGGGFESRHWQEDFWSQYLRLICGTGAKWYEAQLWNDEKRKPNRSKVPHPTSWTIFKKGAFKIYLVIQFMKIIFVGGESKNWDTWSQVSLIYYWRIILINRKANQFNLQ